MENKTKDEGAKPTIGGPICETECKDGACCWNINESSKSPRPPRREWTDD